MNFKETDDKINSHVMVINDMDRLLNSDNDDKHKKYFCKNCLVYFYK